jgi:hypothetical protein
MDTPYSRQAGELLIIAMWSLGVKPVSLKQARCHVDKNSLS